MMDTMTSRICVVAALLLAAPALEAGGPGGGPGELIAAPGGEPVDELTRTEEKMAALYEAKEDLKSALKIWQELLAGAPRQPRYLAAVARVLLALDRPALALEPARRLVELQPESSRHRALLVAVLAALDREAEAAPHLEVLRRRSPNDLEVRLQLVAAYQALRRPADALQQIDWLLKRDPRNLDHHRTRADLLGELDRDAERLAELRLILPRLRGEQAASVRRAIAETHLADERFLDAERELQAALAAHPGDTRARSMLVQVKVLREQARRRAEEAQRDAEVWQDWMQDVQDRGEDF